jgi:hypothetical protein
MTPDPHTLMAVNASDSTSDALLNNQTLQRNSARDASATLAAQATAISPCFNSFIASDLLLESPAPIDRRHFPDGTMPISTV